MTGEEHAPFPLDGGRAGDGGDASASGWLPKKQHADGAIVRARRLRKEQTLGERLLWAELRKHRLNIRRQSPMGPYILDFVCHAAKLVVEVDGYHHTLPDRADRDARRDDWLKAQGYKVLRFSDKAVIADVGRIADLIAAEASPPSPTLPPSRGKGVSVRP